MKAYQSPASKEETSSNGMAASTSTSSSTRRAKSAFPIKVYAMLELAENLFELRLSPCSSIRQRFDLSIDSCICGDFVGK